MNAVESYIASLEPRHMELMNELRSMILATPQLKEEFKWNRPVYTLNGKTITYLLATKQAVDLGFNEGAQINDPRGFIEGTGKDMRHVKLTSVESTDFDYLRGLLDQAVHLA